MTITEITRLATAGDIDALKGVAIELHRVALATRRVSIKQGRKIEEQRHEIDALTVRDNARECVCQAAETLHRHVNGCDECTVSHEHIRHFCGHGRELAACVVRCVGNAQQGGE